MKLEAHNILLYVTSLLVTLKSVTSLEREKRVVPESSNPSSSRILRSPFHPPDENGNTINFEENHLRISNIEPAVPKKSPFSPPGSHEHPPQIDVKFSPPGSKPDKTNSKPKLPTGRSKNGPATNLQIHEMSKQNAFSSSHADTRLLKSPTKVSRISDSNNRSPFQRQEDPEFRNIPDSLEGSRPLSEDHAAPRQPQQRPAYRQAVKGKVRKPSTELELIMERQRQNSHAIPSISDIQVNPHQQQQQQQQPQTAKTFRSRPRHTAFQNRAHGRKDMHEAGPGVTPWTRYTDRPRNVGRGRKVPSSSYRGRCGRTQYSPRKQICCQGNVLRRQGIQPSCCRAQTYDAVYKKCCNGQIVMLTESRPGC